MPTQPTIYPKISLTAVPMTLIPCTTPEPPLRVDTVPRGTSIVPPNNRHTGPTFITQEEE